MVEVCDLFESICGSQLWNNKTLYSDYPDLTVCFQQTVLKWSPCFMLWIISPLWVYMLTKQISPKLTFSYIFCIKIVSYDFIPVQIRGVYSQWTKSKISYF